MDRGAWRGTVQGIAKSWTWLSDFHFHFFSEFPSRHCFGGRRVVVTLFPLPQWCSTFFKGIYILQFLNVMFYLRQESMLGWFFFSFYLTLQYCIGFAIYQHEPATGIHMFPILNPSPSLYHPSGSSQCTSPKHPVSCIEPGLATHFIYDIIHASMPFSQIIPPSPSPTESKRLFYTSVSLSLSRIEGCRYHLSKFPIYALVYCIGVFLSGLLHSIIGSSFIHLIRTDSNVFFLMAE